MKKLGKILMVAFLLPFGVKAQIGTCCPDQIYLHENLCSGKIRTVSQFDNLRKIRIRIIDSCSVDERSQSRKSYFIMDSVIARRTNNYWVLDTIVFSSIRLNEIAGQLSSDTVLNGSKDFADILNNSILNLYFFDKNVGFICGQYYHSSITIYFLFKTIDGGKHWISSAPFPEATQRWGSSYLGKEGICMFDKQKWIIVLQPDGGERFGGSFIKYSYTKDGGKTWSYKEIKAGHWLREVTPSFLESGQIILLIKYQTLSDDDEEKTIMEVYQSKNFGETFKKLK